jgi:hypothetical protein
VWLDPSGLRGMINGGAQNLGMPLPTSPWQLYVLEKKLLAPQPVWAWLLQTWLKKVCEALQSPNLVKKPSEAISSILLKNVRFKIRDDDRMFKH